MFRLVLVTALLTLAACAPHPATPAPGATPDVPPVVRVATFTALPDPSALPAGPTVAPAPTVGADLAGAAGPLLAPDPTAEPAPPVWVAPPSSADAAAAEQYTIDLINAQRASAGVAPLARDETLMTIARARVADMVARGYPGHLDPVSGAHLARELMRAAGYTSTYLGENWYASIRPPPTMVDIAMGWFMTDAPHAKNILSPNFHYVGVGITFNGRQWLLVQNFAG